MANKIHHAQLRQAEQYGFTLEDRPPHVRAFHPSTATQIFGVSAKDAIAQMLAFMNIQKYNADIKFTCLDDPRTIGYLRHEGEVSEQGTPVELHRKLVGKEDLHWVRPGDPTPDLSQFEPDPDPKPPVDDKPLIKRSENGVPLDGAIAYKEGIMAGDNPFEEGSDEGGLWDDQWDQAAEDNTESEEDSKGGSVVKSKYRQLYKELGHENHCGDWLAELLNNYCVGSKMTDLETFEKICQLNGVDLSKYNRTTSGWPGRLRMTGRNLLARVVWKNKQVETPDGTKVAPADWLSAQRFKEV